MREIMTCQDTGTTIDFRSQGPCEVRHPWPAETAVCAVSGVVLIRNAKEGERTSYTMLFMEVYPPEAAFIRGEGATPEACEDTAWAKYQRALNCSDGSGSHNWEARGYRNGAGFCSRCGTFGSQIITSEQLDQFCRVCGTGTTYHRDTDNAAGTTTFLCEERYKTHKPTCHFSHDRPLAQLLAALIDEED
ncbi:hypothetical protein OG285_32735 [Streptomyces sp. NBC_01471]|uniref:hypothetical protein n=1 Tax=Streptomyces sp. NBC_01471 TaxID=2903879 RepID=UPI00324DF6E1